MNAVLLCTQLLFPSEKYPTFSLWWGKRGFFFFSFHSDPGFSVSVLLHLLASGLCPLPSPYLIRGSYPLGHCDCFGSGHLTQAGPIRILFWDLFPNSTGEEHLSVFLCWKKAENKWFGAAGSRSPATWQNWETKKRKRRDDPGQLLLDFIPFRSCFLFESVSYPSLFPFPINLPFA